MGLYLPLRSRELSPGARAVLALAELREPASPSPACWGLLSVAVHLACWPKLLLSVQPGNSVLGGLDMSLDPYLALSSSSGKPSAPCHTLARRRLEQVPTSSSPWSVQGSSSKRGHRAAQLQGQGTHTGH